MPKDTTRYIFVVVSFGKSEVLKEVPTIFAARGVRARVSAKSRDTRLGKAHSRPKLPPGKFPKEARQKHSGRTYAETVKMTKEILPSVQGSRSERASLF